MGRICYPGLTDTGGAFHLNRWLKRRNRGGMVHAERGHGRFGEARHGHASVDHATHPIMRVDHEPARSRY